MNMRVLAVLLAGLMSASTCYAVEPEHDVEQSEQGGEEQSAPETPEAPEPSAPTEEPPAPSESPETIESGDNVATPEVKELSAPALFKGSKQGVMTRKQMIADTDEDEREVRKIAQRLDAVKSKHLADYLGIDKELDDFYAEVGLARGKAAENIGDIKALVLGKLNEQGADDKLQAQIAEREAKMDELEQQASELAGKEAAVVAVLKELSETINGAIDKAGQMYSRRLELMGVMDDAQAQNMHEQIKGTQAALQAVEKEIAAPEGVVSRLDKAITDARASMAAVKATTDQLKNMDVDLARAAQEAAQAQEKQAGQEASEKQEVESTSEESAPQPGTDAKKKRTPVAQQSFMAKMVKGTALEKPYKTTTEVAGVVWKSIAPVRAVFMTVAGWIKDGIVAGARMISNNAKTPAAVDNEPKYDPVLERIRQERNEAYRKSQELKKQEAARLQQITGDDKRAGEVSWKELGITFVSKLFASMRRGVVRIADWVQGSPVQPAKKKQQEVTKPEPTPAQVSEPVKQDAPATDKQVPSKQLTVAPPETPVFAGGQDDVVAAQKEAADKAAKEQTAQEKAASDFASGARTPENAAKALLTEKERAAVNTVASSAMSEADAAIKAAREAANKASAATK